MLTRNEIADLATRMLLSAWNYSDPSHATIVLPGPEGGRGSRVDGLEGFARTFLMAAFYLRGENSATENKTAHRIAQWYIEGFTSGVNPQNSKQWITPLEASQARVEAASLALGLDMTREWIWRHLDTQTQDRLIKYLSEVVGNDAYPHNNWLWFRIVTETFLHSVGGPWSPRDLEYDLQLFDSFYRADGWYQDGLIRGFDHYQGWALHFYPALWQRMSVVQNLISELDLYDRHPGIRCARPRLERYLEDAIRLIGANGSPMIQGRSLIYRFAAAAPFWTGIIERARLGNQSEKASAAQMRDAALRIIGHFTDRGALGDDALLRCGWLVPSMIGTQTYSGPSSAYWAAKGLLGLTIPAENSLWGLPPSKLPVDDSDYIDVISAPGWAVSGTSSDGIVRIFNHGTDDAAQTLQVRGDSPLYSRLGYSTHTSPLLGQKDWHNPTDMSAALVNAEGTLSHRSGLIKLGCVSTPEVATVWSSSWTRWMSFGTQDHEHGSGWQGKCSYAGLVEVASLVRKEWEVRLVRTRFLSEETKGLEISGWPTVCDLHSIDPQPLSRVTLLDALGHQESTVREIGYNKGSENSLLGRCAKAPYVQVECQENGVTVAATCLTSPSTTSATANSPEVVHLHTNGAAMSVTITWPDGTTTHSCLDSWETRLLGALEDALETVRNNVSCFRESYPDDCTDQGIYPQRPKDAFDTDNNLGWTTGFWTGLLWLAYELTGDTFYRSAAETHSNSFAARLKNRQDTDHHDLGFLYTLAATYPHDLTEQEPYRKMANAAASQLLERVHQTAGIVQAWGNLDDPNERGRVIIDSLMNMSLLHWASTNTGNPLYAEVAVSHVKQLENHIMRKDGTTFHTYHFDPETGKASHGSTAQGHSDESCWARGQAWGIYGFALNYALTKEYSLLETSQKCADAFIERLPADNVSYWDMVFTDGDQPRDSSASAIAVCGLLELSDNLADKKKADLYRGWARKIMDSLVSKYATKPQAGGALLKHAVYSIPHGRGVDEGCLWGDYFYLEALVRMLYPQWKAPWLTDSQYRASNGA